MIPARRKPSRSGIERVPTPLFAVTIFTADRSKKFTSLYTAPTASKARYRAYQDFSASFDYSFREFMAFPLSVRKAEPPAKPDDGYDYVRRNYGVDPTIGGLVRIKNEGPSWNGKVVEVIYPGVSTAHVVALADGRELHFHPDSCEVI